MTQRGRQAASGVIAGFTGGTTRYFPGKSGLRDAIDYADRRGLKVCVFSTPESILRDLQGSRAHELSPSGAKYPKRTPLYDSPEEKMLRGARRLDLLEWPPQPRRWWPVRIFRKGERTP